jgi:UDP:flavonoid glycosyltransferase YjiC (YdhE family)
VARAVRAILDEPEFAQRAAGVAQQIALEDGVKTACDALETLHLKMTSL